MERLFERLRKPLLLFLVAGIPAAVVPPFFPETFFSRAPDLCFTAGTTTYQVTPGAPQADFRVRIAAPGTELRSQDLRIQIIDDVDAADFALVDDVTADPSACDSVGNIKTVEVVSKDSPADVAVSLSRDGTEGDLKLFVHSARIGHQDAAALLAVMRHDQGTRLALAH
jgi:hypothetical protein